MEGISDRRQRTLDRIRSFLCFSVSLSDAVDVLSFRTFCLAESAAPWFETVSGLPHRTPWSAVHSGRVCANSVGLLSGISRHCGRSELVLVLVALDGVADNADRPDVVPVVLDRLERRRRHPLRTFVERRPVCRAALGQSHGVYRPVLRYRHLHFGGDIFSTIRDLLALAMGRNRPI